MRHEHNEHAQHAGNHGGPGAHGEQLAAHAEKDASTSRQGHGAMIADYRKRFWVSLLFTMPILALSPMIQAFLGLERALAFSGDAYVLLALASVAYFYSAAVVLGLAGKVFFRELATLIDVMLLGHRIEMRSVMGASGALGALVKLMPTVAHRLRDGGDSEDVPIADLKPGDRVLVKPGEKVPTDGVILNGRTSLNESMLTGDSKPVERSAGEEAIGGSINGEGAITLEIRKTGDETYLSQVIEMVRQAQASRSRTQDLANRAAQWLTYIALIGGTLTLIIWLSSCSIRPERSPRGGSVSAISSPWGRALRARSWRSRPAWRVSLPIPSRPGLCAKRRNAVSTP